MKTKIIFIIIAAGFVLMFSCKKKETSVPKPTTPLEFTSFTVDLDTIETGGTTTVRAIAKGDNLNYQWSTSHGDLFGSGAAVMYGAAYCCAGQNAVYCKVSDGTNSLSKEVTITVVVPEPH